MALQSTKGPVPEGAVVLRRDQAAFYQFEQIQSWPNHSDVWPFKYGIPALSFLAGITGLRINRHFRLKLKLKRYGLASTQLAMGLTPMMFSSIPHLLFVGQDIFINDIPCALCLQTRAMVIQIGSAVIYPLMMSPIASFMFAARHATYALPYWADHKGNLELWLKIVKPFRNKILALAVINAIASSFITYREIISIKHFQIESLKWDNEMRKKKKEAVMKDEKKN